MKELIHFIPMLPFFNNFQYYGAFEIDCGTEESVCIRNFSGLQYPTFELNTETYSVNLRSQSECAKMRTRKTRIQTLVTQCLLRTKSKPNEFFLTHVHVHVMIYVRG